MAAPIQYCIMGVVLNANWTIYLQSPVELQSVSNCTAILDHVGDDAYRYHICISLLPDVNHDHYCKSMIHT